MILGGCGIGQVAVSTKSIIVSAWFHKVIQIMMVINTLVKNGIDGTEKLIILGGSVVTWFVIIKKRKKKTHHCQKCIKNIAYFS